MIKYFFYNSLLFCLNSYSYCFVHRIIGYIACSGIGYVISLIGSLVLFGGFTQTNVTLFAILYVIGNVVSLCGTLFLIGPRKQCIKMWDSSRRWSTAFYLSMIIIVFAVGVSKQNIIIILFMLAIQIVAGAWYSLSYVPFGRKFVLTILRASNFCYPCFAVSDYIQTCFPKKSTMETLTGSKSTSKTNSGFFGGDKKASTATTGSGLFGAKTAAPAERSSGFFGSKA